MKFLWVKNGYERNTRVRFYLETDGRGDTLVIHAADSFRVFLDGKFVCYGPLRTAAGYSRRTELALRGTKTVEIEVAAYNILNYSCDFQKPFFGAEVLCDGKVIYTAEDFTAYEEDRVVKNVPKFSAQRGFIEVFDLTKTGVTVLETEEVTAPKLLAGFEDFCDYRVKSFTPLAEGEFKGFENMRVPPFLSNPAHAAAEGAYDIDVEFLKKTETGYRFTDLKTEHEYTGFLKLTIEAEEETELFAAMDEFLVDGKWYFRRSGCNDLIAVKVPQGKWVVQTFEPYAFQYLKLIYKGGVKITPELIALQNDRADFVTVEGCEKYTRLFNAAKNSFCQNSLDIFMDCPGRERAGWLCDSFFTAKAERLFTGKNTIERAFLENILIADTPELPKGMLPKCFPSEHRGGLYIPNWGMWFVVELYDYYLRTGDKSLVELAKDKVYGLVEFFDKYVNEYGLLENLESWVFVEWSICNDKEYLKGVNFPSNILFADMLACVDKLYGDEALRIRAEKMREEILRLSFDGELFADNAVRVDGKLLRCDGHLSETCQYYALFFGLKPSEEFAEKIKTQFGPCRAKEYRTDVGRSNMFIGNYLRFFWLAEEKEYERILTETTEYFAEMAEKTGTLWEHDSPHASCNHGFASVAAVLLLRCVTGYLTVKDGKPVFEKDFDGVKGYDLRASFA